VEEEEAGSTVRKDDAPSAATGVDERREPATSEQAERRRDVKGVVTEQGGELPDGEGVGDAQHGVVEAHGFTVRVDGRVSGKSAAELRPGSGTERARAPAALRSSLGSPTR
jgi:hypothetical protein